MKKPKTKIITGAAATLLGIVSLNTDLLYGLDNGNWSLSQSHSYCSSDMGAALSYGSDQIRSNCTTIANAYAFTWLVIIAGVALIVWGAWQKHHNSRGEI